MHENEGNVAMRQANRHIHCPTCRARTKVTDIALVDAGRSAAKEEGQSDALADEEQIVVSGSYSTKVCTCSRNTTRQSTLAWLWSEGLIGFWPCQAQSSTQLLFLLSKALPFYLSLEPTLFRYWDTYTKYRFFPFVFFYLSVAHHTLESSLP